MGGRPAFAGLEEVDAALCVYGLPADLWPDDGGPPPPLVAWAADATTSADHPPALVDRFDARLLLDRPPPGVGGYTGRRRSLPPADEELAADAALAAEVEGVAWADLQQTSQEQRPPPSAASPSSPLPSQAPGAEIAPPAGLAAPGDGGQVAPEPFIPPPNLPPGLAAPSTAKAAAIIARTADFVRAVTRNRRAATEIALRTAQAGNPRFEFLEAGSALHAYYRWCVEGGGGGSRGGEEEEKAAGQAAPSPVGGLPGLGAYGSSSSSSSEDGGDDGDTDGRGEGGGGGEAGPASLPPPPKRAKGRQSGGEDGLDERTCP